MLDLIQQAKDGDKDAFGKLYSELYTPLYRFVKSRTRDHEKSIDICQETFVKWYRSLETYEVKIKPLSYLIMISMRLIINDSKKKSSVELPENADEFIGDDAEPLENILDFKVEVQKIKDLFEHLNQDQQNVLTMRYLADADTQTIAEALDKTVVNIRKIESRGLQKLRQIYKDKYEK